MIKSIKFWIAMTALFLILIYFASSNKFISCFKYEFTDKSSLTLNLTLINPQIHAIACDPANKLVLKIRVLNSSDIPVPMAHVGLSVDSGKGNIYPKDVRTDNNGEALVTYIPPIFSSTLSTKENSFVNITSNIKGTQVKSNLKLELKRTPVILIHGYQASSLSFKDMMDFLDAKGFETSAIDYESENGVAAGSKTLNNFIEDRKLYYLSKGLQVEKFDLVAHSMGGLVARYYTCSRQYLQNNDVRKIIFISVPQNGSPLASIGEAYFSDLGIADLVPENKLYSTIFPGMINKGLNSTIQIGSICGQYDEVVSHESASLEEWKIQTEFLAIGKNNFNVDNLLNGDITKASNHMSILINKKVFEKIYIMLSSELPYPAILR